MFLNRHPPHVLFVLLFFQSQLSISRSSCQTTTLCQIDSTSNVLICDATWMSDDSPTPNLSCYPPGNHYTFRHFQRLSPSLLETLRFPVNQSIHIHLFNVSLIESETFSRRLNIPLNSKLSIDIEQRGNSSSSLTLQTNAFDRLEISHLRFLHVNNFNGRSIFDTSALGAGLDIDQLIFDQCAITGFLNSDRKAAEVKHLSILHSSALTQLTQNSLPSFHSQLISLTIENTSLQLINSHTFKAWTMSLEQLTLINNQKLETFPSNIIDGALMKLTQLDLSENPIRTFADDFDWFAFHQTKYLILRSSPLDVYLRTNLLTSLSSVELIDFSNSYFLEKNHTDLIRNGFPDDMSSLISMNLSNAKINESILIEILTKFSEILDHQIDIDLFGHRLSEENYCSYLNIIKSAPNFLRLHLDSSHPCNCIVDLFDIEECSQCDQHNLTLIYRCQLSSSKGDDGIGSYAFTGLIAGLSAFVVIILVGAAWIYRRRRQRQYEIDMEDPIDNPLAVVIQQRLKRH